MDPLVYGSMSTLQNPYLAFKVTVACLGGVLYWVYIALVFVFAVWAAWARTLRVKAA